MLHTNSNYYYYYYFFILISKRNWYSNSKFQILNFFTKSPIPSLLFYTFISMENPVQAVKR